VTGFGTLIADLWTYMNRSLTDKTGFGLAAGQDVRNVSGSLPSVTVGGYAAGQSPATLVDLSAVALEASVQAVGATATAALASADAAARPADVTVTVNPTSLDAAERAAIAAAVQAATPDVVLVLEGGAYFLSVRVKGTATEIARKRLLQADGSAVTALSQVVAQQVEVAL
jgi:hypothetical protein